MDDGPASTKCRGNAGGSSIESELSAACVGRSCAPGFNHERELGGDAMAMLLQENGGVIDLPGTQLVRIVDRRRMMTIIKKTSVVKNFDQSNNLIGRKNEHVIQLNPFCLLVVVNLVRQRLLT